MNTPDERNSTMCDQDHLRDDPSLPAGPEYDGTGHDAGGRRCPTCGGLRMFAPCPTCGTDPDLAGAVGDELAAPTTPPIDLPAALAVSAGLAAVDKLSADLARVTVEAHVWRQRYDSAMRFNDDEQRLVVLRTQERDAALEQVRQLEADNLELIGRLEVADSILTVEQARDATRQRELLAAERADRIEAERHEALTRPASQHGPAPVSGPFGDDQALNAYDAELGDQLRNV